MVSALEIVGGSSGFGNAALQMNQMAAAAD
jgi:hypothetical protein